MKRRYKRLLKMLYDDAYSKCKLVNDYYRHSKFAKSIGAIRTAEYFDELARLQSEENERILTAIYEIEKRVS